MRDLLLTDSSEIERTFSGYASVDPFLAAMFAGETPAFVIRRDRAVALLGEGRDGRRLVARGDVGAVLRLIERNSDRLGGVAHALLPYGIAETYPGRVEEILDVKPRGAWEWMSCYTPPPHQCDEERCGVVDDLAAVDRVLETSYPDAIDGTGVEGLTWWGFRDDGGGLLSVCALRIPGDRASGHAHPGVQLSSFATFPELRGRGIGRALMAAITRWSVQNHYWVNYGVWMDNPDAVRLYRRLGYSTGAQIQHYTNR